MRKLLQDFIELPTHQGIALIVFAVLAVALLCLWISRISYRRGVADSIHQLDRTLEKIHAGKRSIRL